MLTVSKILLHLHAGLFDDDGLVRCMRDASTVPDEIGVHPVVLIRLDGPVVRICTPQHCQGFYQTPLVQISWHDAPHRQDPHGSTAFVLALLPPHYFAHTSLSHAHVYITDATLQVADTGQHVLGMLPHNHSGNFHAFAQATSKFPGMRSDGRRERDSQT